MNEEGKGYDPARLRRAAVLAVKRIGPSQFRVRGQDEPHYDVDISADVPCYCKDAEHHGVGCKHFLAAKLASGDQALRMALGEMLLTLHKENAALMKRNRRKKSA